MPKGAYSYSKGGSKSKKGKKKESVKDMTDKAFKNLKDAGMFKDKKPKKKK